MKSQSLNHKINFLAQSLRREKARTPDRIHEHLIHQIQDQIVKFEHELLISDGEKLNIEWVRQ